MPWQAGCLSQPPGSLKVPCSSPFPIYFPSFYPSMHLCLPHQSPLVWVRVSLSSLQQHPGLLRPWEHALLQSLVLCPAIVSIRWCLEVALTPILCVASGPSSLWFIHNIDSHRYHLHIAEWFNSRQHSLLCLPDLLHSPILTFWSFLVLPHGLSSSLRKNFI